VIWTIGKSRWSIECRGQDRRLIMWDLETTSALSCRPRVPKTSPGIRVRERSTYGRGFAGAVTTETGDVNQRCGWEETPKWWEVVDGRVFVIYVMRRLKSYAAGHSSASEIVSVLFNCISATHKHVCVAAELTMDWITATCIGISLTLWLLGSSSRVGASNTAQNHGEGFGCWS